ncbi:MAG TPA: 4'-phosphopantetheinyl transferase superfamily protein, partial [Pseudonocardia sp.]|nr:4'-phosphopantetheinyl transferase superfamily protein [Pseudonocardia sp.]
VAPAAAREPAVPVGLGDRLAAAGAVVAVARAPGGRPGERDTAARLLRVLLRRLGVPDDGWELRREPHGRPVLRMRAAPAGVPAPGCSISHSGGLVAVCVADGGAVGVDVQELPTGPDRHWLRVAGRWLHAEESAALARRAAVDPAGARAAFTTVWAVREARCKATGSGLAGLASPDPVRPFPAARGAEPGTGHGGRLGGVWWRTLDAPAGFALAVARADGGGESLLHRSVTVWTHLDPMAAEPVVVVP